MTFQLYLQTVSREPMHQNRNGDIYMNVGLYTDCYRDPFLRSMLTTSMFEVVRLVVGLGLVCPLRFGL